MTDKQDQPTSAEPLGWIRNGTFVRNPAAFVIGPQTLDWEIPLFAHPPTSAEPPCYLISKDAQGNTTVTTTTAPLDDDPPTSAEPVPPDVERIILHLDYATDEDRDEAIAMLRSLSEDAERWKQLPVVCHELGINFIELRAAIDAALAAKEGK